MNGRILAVDPGEKRIGLAISDPTNTIANPLTVLSHVSRVVDAATIVQLSNDQGVVKIIVGQPLDWDGKVGPSARKSARLAEMIKSQTDITVELWDESGTTREVQTARILMGVSRQKRKGHLDAIAATVILQSYLDRVTR